MFGLSLAGIFFIMALIRFLATVRKLRAGQAVAQLAYRVRNRFERPVSAPEPARLLGVRLQPGSFVPPVQPTANADMRRTGRATFLNRTLDVGWPPDWNLSHPAKLWSYNLHYHDFLWPLPLDDGLSAVRDWMTHYPYAPGRPGWDPYPISLRVQNWCMYFFGKHRRQVLEAPGAVDDLWRSTSEQMFRLRRRIERHLLANHILENGAALAFAGATFAGPSAELWLEEGLAILHEHLEEIVLADGGHAERSPMYHARLCQMMENLVRTGNRRITDVVQSPLERARPVLSHMSHPDREIALLNDSATGVYPGLSDLGMEPARPGVFSLGDCGYYGGRTDDGHYVICDAGPIGPDYQPGHAHGDTLSFELSMRGSRFVVDAGVYGYENDRWRAFARSTRAHNTVELNRFDQSDFWGVFRVGRRAYPRDVEFRRTETGFSLDAEHTGYDHLRGRPVHRRSFRWFSDGTLMIRDRVTARSPVWMRSHLHLHPEVSIDMRGERSLVLRRAGVSCSVSFSGVGKLTVEPSWYFPEFGKRNQNRVVVLSAGASSALTGFCIVPGEEPPRFDVDEGARVRDAVYRW